MNASKNNQITILRGIAILLVLAHHSLAIFQNSCWKVDFFVPKIYVYDYLSISLRSLGVPLFIMISGYIYSYLYVLNRKEQNIKNFFSNKFRRLIIPSIVFSLLYFIIIDRFKTDSWENTIFYITINGLDHLWYLPMLFTCFTFIIIFEKLHIKPLYILILSLLLSPVYKLFYYDLFIAKALYNFIYFCFGYYFATIKIERIPKRWISMICIFLYLILFNIYYYLSQNHLFDTRFLDVFRLSVTIMGVSGLFLYFLKSQNSKNGVIFTIGSYSFGIYLFQEFCFKLLLQYKFIEQINIYVLPILLFSFSLTVSLAITALVVKNKFLKSIIG